MMRLVLSVLLQIHAVARVQVNGVARTQALAIRVDSTVVTVTVLHAPRITDSLWAVVQACSHRTADPAAAARIVWLRGSIRRIRFGYLTMARWLPADTILLDDLIVSPTGAVTDSLYDVVAHELLHQLLHGPLEEDHHPYDPFYAPCRLMYWQRHGGHEDLPFLRK